MGVNQGSTPIPVPTASALVTGFVAGTAGEITGISGRETVGTNPVIVEFRDGASGGRLIATAVFPAGATNVLATNIQWSHGPRFTNGLYALVSGTGTVSATVHII